MFVETELEILLPYFYQLVADSKPLWGEMNAQRVVEHLTDSVLISCGDDVQEQVIADEKLPSMLRFLESEKPMAKNIQVDFARAETGLRNEEMELAVDEFIDVWLRFEEVYETNPGLTHIHPYYGPLDYAQWKRLHAKHFTHHLTQFGLISHES